MKKISKDGQMFTLSKPYRKIAYEMNKAYDEVKQAGITNNTIKLFENTLENFYKKHNKKVANEHHVSMQAQMDESSIKELDSILMSFVDKALNEHNFYLSDIKKSVDPKVWQDIMDKQQEDILEDWYGDYNTTEDMIDMMAEENMEQSTIEDIIPWNEFNVDIYNKIQDKYGIEDVQQFIDWTDEMERYRTNAFLSQVLSSHQIAELFAYAQAGDNKVNRRSLHATIRAQYNKTGYIGQDLYNAVVQRIKTKKSPKKGR